MEKPFRKMAMSEARAVVEATTATIKPNTNLRFIDICPAHTDPEFCRAAVPAGVSTSRRAGRPRTSRQDAVGTKPLSAHPRPVHHVHHLLERRGDATLVIAQRNRPTPAPHFFGCVSHDKRVTGECKHFNIVIVVTNGHDLLAGDTAIIRPSFESMAL